MFSASQKLNINGSELVLENDGSEVSNTEVLIEIRRETLILLEPFEKWSSADCLTDGSTITLTSDMSGLTDLDIDTNNSGSMNAQNDPGEPHQQLNKSQTLISTENQNLIIIEVPSLISNHILPQNEYTWETFEIPWNKIPFFYDRKV